MAGEFNSGAATAATANPPGGGEVPPEFARRIGKKFAKSVERAALAERERDEAKAALAEVQKEMETLRKSAAKAEALQGELTSLKWRKVGDEALKAAGVRPDALEDFYRLTELEMKGEPNVDKIKVFAAEWKEKKPFLFGTNGQAEAEAGTTNFTPAQLAQLAQGQGGEGSPLRPAPGRGQGGTGRNDAGKFFVTKQQQRDPAFCFSPAYEAALKAGIVEVID